MILCTLCFTEVFVDDFVHCVFHIVECKGPQGHWVENFCSLEAIFDPFLFTSSISLQNYAQDFGTLFTIKQIIVFCLWEKLLFLSALWIIGRIIGSISIISIWFYNPESSFFSEEITPRFLFWSVNPQVLCSRSLWRQVPEALCWLTTRAPQTATILSPLRWQWQS